MVKIRSASKRRHAAAIPYATFKRLVKEISDDKMLSRERLKWSEKAIRALHEDSEAYLAEHFQNANYLRETFRKQTLDTRLFHTAMNLAGAQQEVPCSDTS